VVCWKIWRIELEFLLCENHNSYIRQQGFKDMMVNGSFGMKLMLIESLNLLKNTTVLEDQGKWNCEFGSKLWLCTRSVKDKITGVAREVTSLHH